MKRGLCSDGVYTFDHKKIHIGDWICDTSGVFEITEIHASMNKVYGQEVYIDDNDPNIYRLEAHHAWNCNEIGHFYMDCEA